MNLNITLSGGALLNALQPEIEYNHEWIGAAEYEKRGLELVIREIEKTEKTVSIRILLNNTSKETFRLGGIRLRQTGRNGDFLQADGRDLHLYLEGWSMPSPCGLRKFGDRDFQFNPEYMPVAVAEPKEYIGDRENCFRAEHALGIQNMKSGEALLIGFVTTADQYGRFRIQLDEQGVALLEIIAGFDDRIVEPGDLVLSEEIEFFSGNDMNALLDDFGTVWGKMMNARVHAKLPVGWCSWYYYFSKVTEKDMLENIEFLKAHRAEYPLEYIQLDDGYQPACGDWLGLCEKFPRGLGYWADDARKNGFKPALWLAPFFVEQTADLFKQHPEWCIHNEKGEILFPMKWRGNPTAILDGTHPGVQNFFRELFAKLRAMGFEYVKLDFMVFSSVARDGVLYDKKATRAQAFRRGLAAIREGFGTDGFILGCTAPFGPCVGLVDGERIATDITPYWAGNPPLYDEAPTVPNVCRNGIHHSYMHRKLYLNDPDTHIARTDNNKMTEEEVKLWTAALKINGGMLLLSDRFETLIPERAAYSKMLLAEPDAFVSVPLDRMERTVPAVWFARHRTEQRALFGLFNFEDVPQTVSAKLPVRGTMKELFSGKTVETLPATLEPHTCFVVEINGSDC